ncbi:MAG: hypothetical protein ACYDB7_07050 [Mycobacteriales bacterium]
MAQRAYSPWLVSAQRGGADDRDRVLLDEIELLAEAMIAGEAAPQPLTFREVDDVLGVHGEDVA